MASAFDPTQSTLAGVATATLQQWLAAAQQAYNDLSTGAKAVTVSYTQGDGARSVTYTRAEIASLGAYIRLLQAQLGIVCRGRRPVRFLYR